MSLGRYWKKWQWASGQTDESIVCHSVSRNPRGTDVRIFYIPRKVWVKSPCSAVLTFVRSLIGQSSQEACLPCRSVSLPLFPFVPPVPGSRRESLATDRLFQGCHLSATEYWDASPVLLAVAMAMILNISTEAPSRPVSKPMDGMLVLHTGETHPRAKKQSGKKNSVYFYYAVLLGVSIGRLDDPEIYGFGHWSAYKSRSAHRRSPASVSTNIATVRVRVLIDRRLY